MANPPPGRRRRRRIGSSQFDPGRLPHEFVLRETGPGRRRSESVAQQKANFAHLFAHASKHRGSLLSAHTAAALVTRARA
jgi:hypothetical protein